MKAVVLQIEGSAAKTTTALNVLYPHIPGAKLVTVDKTNESGKDFGIKGPIYTSDEFKTIYKDIIVEDNLIVDVGGSKEAEQFLEEMDWAQGHDEVDYFIIPSKPDDKSQKAAIRTIEILLAQGVSKEKIKPVFAIVKRDTASEFPRLLGALQDLGIAFSLDATIFENNLYDILSKEGRTVRAMAEDKTDYKAQMLAATDEDTIEKLTDLVWAQKTAVKIDKHLHGVFNALFPAKKAAKTAPATTPEKA